MTWLSLVPLFILLVTLCTSMIAATWKLSGIGTKVDLILTNHLPHMQADIKELRSEVLDLYARPRK